MANAAGAGQVPDTVRYAFYAGAGVLAYTAGHMIVSEPLLDEVYDPNLAIRMATYALLIGGVLAAGWWAAHHRQPAQADASAS